MCMLWCDIATKPQLIDIIYLFRMAQLNTVYIKIYTRFLFSEVLNYLMQYIGFALLIQLIASVGLLV